MRALFGAVIFLGAFLLFSLEPLVAKQILPWFGGSAAVWCTCLVFFQVALLSGYLYARAITVQFSPKRQAFIHTAILLGSLSLLPIGPSHRWAIAPSDQPVWPILAVLLSTIGFPFVALSATNPLFQHWLAASGDRAPYRLFAVSNTASLLALLSYPAFIEPTLDIEAQRLCWSWIYVAFVASSIAGAWWSAKSAQSIRAVPPDDHTTPPRLQGARWFALSACGSMLLLSITNHLTQNIAAVPLLWVLPLAVYLLTFILAFSQQRIYKRPLWARLLALALGALGYGIYDINAIVALQISLPVFLGGLFICCMFCHGELNRLRPGTHQLTTFYLIIAAGGAAGAVFVGIAAPLLFSGIYELPLTLVFTAFIALLIAWPEDSVSERLLWCGITAGMALVFAGNVKAFREDALTLRRSFYGSLRVIQSRHAGEGQTRALFHGTIEHGAQFLLPPMRFRPTTYYGPESAIGIVLRECFANAKRVGIVGLGVGTIAAYGKTGDTFKFYEINRQVEEIAQSLFFYLRESRARIEIATGDARLSLEQEASPPFDVIAVDAFSGDAIPVHLITRESFALYWRHLQPDGVLAFHVSNDYLDLASVVDQLSKQAGYRAVLVRNHANDEELVLPADWVVVTRNKAVLENESIKVHTLPILVHPDERIWTDDYNNLLQILKTPRWR